MSCKYNNCKTCGYKSECEIYKENTGLKEELKDADEKVVHLACNQNKDLKRKLTKAKEIIEDLCGMVRELNKPNVQLTNVDCSLSEAEQFLSEVEKCGQ